MRNMIRSVLAVIAGLVAAFVIVLVFDGVSIFFFPLPAGVDPTDPEALKVIAQNIPAGAFMILIAGWAASALAGAWLAGRLAGRAPFVHGLVAAGLFLIVSVINLLSLPHPLWVWAAGLVVLMGGGYAGAQLAARTTPAVASSS